MLLLFNCHRSTEELKCPECHEVVSKENVFNDNAALREILNLWCYCSGKTRGCHWEGEIRALQVGIIGTESLVTIK